MRDSRLVLNVENLGPVERCRLDLRPLTVLLGRNNTGKTYVAQALYAALKAVEDTPIPRLPLEEKQQESLYDLLRKLRDGETDRLPPDLRPMVGEWLGRIFRACQHEFKTALRYQFNVKDENELTRWEQEDGLSIDLHSTTPSGGTHRLFGLKNVATVVVPSLISDMRLDQNLASHEINVALHRLERSLNRPESVESRLRYSLFPVAHSLWTVIIAQLSLSTTVFYLPAGRSGLMAAWTDVVRLQQRRMKQSYGLRSLPEPAIGGTAHDFLWLAGQLLTDQSFSGPRRPIRKRPPAAIRDSNGPMQTLSQLLEGAITVMEDERDTPLLGYERSGESIPVERASSGVADVAPLALWIQNLVRPGDVLIVDEPESHLHPAAIRIMARTLVRLVSSGVGVVCATHSSVLLHELSNCIMRGTLRSRGADHFGEGYSAHDCIDVRDVAVHRFVKGRDEGYGVIVEQVDVKPDWGIPEDDYVEVAKELAQDSGWLADRIEAMS